MRWIIAILVLLGLLTSEDYRKWPTKPNKYDSLMRAVAKEIKK